MIMFLRTEDVVDALPELGRTWFEQYKTMSVDDLVKDAGETYWETRERFHVSLERASEIRDTVNPDAQLPRLGKFLGLLQNPVLVNGEINFLRWFPSRAECKLLAEYCVVPETQLKFFLKLGDAGAMKRAIIRREGLAPEFLKYVKETTNPGVNVVLRVSPSVPDEDKVLWVLADEPVNDKDARKDKIPFNISVKTLVVSWNSLARFSGWSRKHMIEVAAPRPVNGNLWGVVPHV